MCALKSNSLEEASKTLRSYFTSKPLNQQYFSARGPLVNTPESSYVADAIQPSCAIVSVQLSSSLPACPHATQSCNSIAPSTQPQEMTIGSEAVRNCLRNTCCPRQHVDAESIHFAGMHPCNLWAQPPVRPKPTLVSECAPNALWSLYTPRVLTWWAIATTMLGSRNQLPNVPRKQGSYATSTGSLLAVVSGNRKSK